MWKMYNSDPPLGAITMCESLFGFHHKIKKKIGKIVCYLNVRSFKIGVLTLSVQKNDSS